MQHLSEIVEEARKKGKKRLAVAYGQDAHIAVADICKVRYAGVYADFGVLYLYKVAYLYSTVQVSIRTQMHKRTCLSTAIYLAFVSRRTFLRILLRWSVVRQEL